MTRNKELRQAFSHASVPDVVSQLRSECLDLLQWRQVGSSFSEQRPKCERLMKVLGATDRIQTMVTQLMDIKRVEAIATAVAKPRIDLHYFDGGQAIPFEKASDGQRAAALLFMLLEQPGGALIIDQPEGDLDNRIIAELTEKIHRAKEKRQLVFARPQRHQPRRQWVGRASRTSRCERYRNSSSRVRWRDRPARSVQRYPPQRWKVVKKRSRIVNKNTATSRD